MPIINICPLLIEHIVALYQELMFDMRANMFQEPRTPPLRQDALISVNWL